MGPFPKYIMLVGIEGCLIRSHRVSQGGGGGGYHMRGKFIPVYKKNKILLVNMLPLEDKSMFSIKIYLPEWERT
jgi:hypothetical protein